MNKKHPVVKGKWHVKIEPEFFLSVTCPNKKCNNLLQDYILMVPGKKHVLSFYKAEGERINQLVVCPYCKTKFKLKVSETDY